MKEQAMLSSILPAFDGGITKQHYTCLQVLAEILNV